MANGLLSFKVHVRLGLSKLCSVPRSAISSRVPAVILEHTLEVADVIGRMH